MLITGALHLDSNISGLIFKIGVRKVMQPCNTRRDQQIPRYIYCLTFSRFA